MKLEMLLNLAQKEGIFIEYVDFSPIIQGLYYKTDGCPPVAGINQNIVSNKRLFTCVLAEEIGHHFTSVGDTSAEYYSYANRVSLNKTELIALKWATEYLLPLDEIIRGIKEVGLKLEDLSDFLEITPEFLLERFKFLSKKQPYIKINNDIFVALTNLPNIYLYKSYCENKKYNNTFVAEFGEIYHT